jgi:hypothetical protein
MDGAFFPHQDRTIGETAHPIPFGALHLIRNASIERSAEPDRAQRRRRRTHPHAVCKPEAHGVMDGDAFQL